MKRLTEQHGVKAPRGGEQYRRLSKRLGKKKALVAVAQSSVVIISHLLKEQQSYRELGAGYVAEQEQEAIKRRAIRRLEQLGYRVTLQEADQVA